MMSLRALMIAIGLLAGPTTALAAPAACAAPEFRQLDFWVGRWDVYPTGKDKLVAHSLIEQLYGGCAIRENWMPLQAGGDGGSLNNYVPGDPGWRQTWLDASGARVEFRGGWDGKAMVLTGMWAGVLGPGKDALVRMTYTKGADGSVRQFGEASTDGGKSWTTNFDFTYRPARPAG